MALRIINSPLCHSQSLYNSYQVSQPNIHLNTIRYLQQQIAKRVSSAALPPTSERKTFSNILLLSSSINNGELLVRKHCSNINLCFVKFNFSIGRTERTLLNYQQSKRNFDRLCKPCPSTNIGGQDGKTRLGEHQSYGALQPGAYALREYIWSGKAKERWKRRRFLYGRNKPKEIEVYLD